LQADHHWPGLKAIGRIVHSRETPARTTTETAYYLLSSALSPDRLNEVVRSHWDVENRLHRRFNVVMNEDQVRTRLGNGPNNLAILRRMVLNLWQKDKAKGYLRGNSHAPNGIRAICQALSHSSEMQSPWPAAHVPFASIDICAMLAS